MSYPLTCDTCGTSGTVDDGIEMDGPCQYEECDGTIRGTITTVQITLEIEYGDGSPDEARYIIAELVGDLAWCDELAGGGVDGRVTFSTVEVVES